VYALLAPTDALSDVADIITAHSDHLRQSAHAPGKTSTGLRLFEAIQVLTYRFDTPTKMLDRFAPYIRYNDRWRPFRDVRSFSKDQLTDLFTSLLKMLRDRTVPTSAVSTLEAATVTVRLLHLLTLPSFGTESHCVKVLSASAAKTLSTSALVAFFQSNDLPLTPTVLKALDCTHLPVEVPFADVPTPVLRRVDLHDIHPDSLWWDHNGSTIRSTQGFTGYGLWGVPTHSLNHLRRRVALSDWLVSRLGDGLSQRSQDAWVAMFAFASAAADARTLDDLVSAAVSHVPPVV
jgi:hypothetical protein